MPENMNIENMLCTVCFTSDTVLGKDDNGANCYKCPECGDITYTSEQTDDALIALKCNTQNLNGKSVQKEGH
jgi:predicted RNA-binding Zn-ribbon protein involved in translation (DUF1610 family)